MKPTIDRNSQTAQTLSFGVKSDACEGRIVKATRLAACLFCLYSGPAQAADPCEQARIDWAVLNEGMPVYCTEDGAYRPNWHGDAYAGKRRSKPGAQPFGKTASDAEVSLKDLIEQVVLRMTSQTHRL